MSSICLWLFVAEIELAIFIIWGFLHEDKILKIERKIGRICKICACKVKQAVRERNAAK